MLSGVKPFISLRVISFHFPLQLISRAMFPVCGTEGGWEGVDTGSDPVVSSFSSKTLHLRPSTRGVQRGITLISSVAQKICNLCL